MLYVEQSLNPNEEIIRVGHFHWFYTLNASLWIVFGFLAMIAILWGGYYWEVTSTISSQFQGLPENLKAQAWGEVVKAKGGFFGVIGDISIVVKIIAFGVFAMGLLNFTNMMVVKATTEICITNDRLILKRGLIARNVDEMNVDRIEGVNVNQGILGRIFNYGLVIVRGMGVGEVVLPPIEDPVGFRRAIDQAKALDEAQK